MEFEIRVHLSHVLVLEFETCRSSLDISDKFRWVYGITPRVQGLFVGCGDLIWTRRHPGLSGTLDAIAGPGRQGLVLYGCFLGCFH